MRQRRMIWTLERIERNSVVDGNGCWIWQGALDTPGYACYGNPKIYISRIAGRVREGFIACHRCDVRACVNPDHIYEGTYSDNNRDAWARSGKGRYQWKRNRNPLNAAKIAASGPTNPQSTPTSASVATNTGSAFKTPALDVSTS